MFVLRVFNSPALSILGVSFAVSIITLPLYFMAEKHQKSEREIQKRMKKDIDNIKSVYSGDERFMLLSAYYRQNGYHPVYSLRSSISLIIQIPFFIAAYHFLVNLEMIREVSFGPINDLAKADSMLQINNLNINILPIIMTIINCMSALVYTKGLFLKDKIQLYGMAVVFLILLYSSPAGIVLYWTGNNLFSLVKNIIQKTKYPKLIIMIIISALCLFMDIYILFFHDGALIKRLTLVSIITVIPVLPFLYKAAIKIIQDIKNILIKKGIIKTSVIENNDKKNTRIFILSIITLFLLTGLVIPSLLIVSSVQEYSYIENNTSPFPFIISTLMQSLGLFVLWPLCIYFLFSSKIKKIFAITAACIACVSLINVFMFPGDYGYMTITFFFSKVLESENIYYTYNMLIIFIVIIFMLIIYRFKNIKTSILTVFACALFLYGIVNSININNRFISFTEQRANNEIIASNNNTYTLSKTGKNVVIIMIDRALSGFIPYIFEEKPGLYDSFDGFTWYRNTVSFGTTTNFGLPGLFGGYEYTPLGMQARREVALVDKHNEALLLLPRIFLENEFEVTVTDPSYANYSLIPDLSIFNNYPQINVDNVIDKNAISWLINRPDLISINLTEVINSNLIRFSFFRIIPMMFRNFIYDHGRWLSTMKYSNSYGESFLSAFLNNYIALDILPDITQITDKNINTYNSIINNLTHEPYHFLQAPDYTLVSSVTNIGGGKFADEKNYHVNIAAILLIGKWLDYLKENDAYDNTRVIVVSDHGLELYSDYEGNIILPNNKCLANYTALLMVKDFNSHGKLQVNNDFMTNADVPVIALDNIVLNPVNPYTGKEIKSGKEDGATLTTSVIWEVERHPRYHFDIKPDEWLHVHTNIFEKENWSSVVIR